MEDRIYKSDAPDVVDARMGMTRGPVVSGRYHARKRVATSEQTGGGQDDALVVRKDDVLHRRS